MAISDSFDQLIALHAAAAGRLQAAREASARAHREETEALHAVSDIQGEIDAAYGALCTDAEHGTLWGERRAQDCRRAA